MAHQGYLRRIAKVEQCLSVVVTHVVTCGMLPNCVRMVCDLLVCLGRHSAKNEPLLEITDDSAKNEQLLEITDGSLSYLMPI